MEEENKDAEGMGIYEYIVDHVDTCEAEMAELICRLRLADQTGQFLASTARYLSAVDREKFDRWLTPLIEGAIEKDKDRRYIGSLLEGIWGEDYQSRAEELKEADSNFRRIYKRIYSGDQPM